jgi:hypothetical protein
MPVYGALEDGDTIIGRGGIGAHSTLYVSKFNPKTERQDIINLFKPYALAV